MGNYRVRLTRPDAPGYKREVVIEDAINESDAISTAENMYGGEAIIAIRDDGSSSFSSDDNSGCGVFAFILVAAFVYIAIHAWWIILFGGAILFIIWLLAD